jgi:hypothetical protein
MDTLTPDELNALCEIPVETYVELAMAARTELGVRLLHEVDREVLKRWYGREKTHATQRRKGKLA